MSYKTLAEFSNPLDAHVRKSKLDVEGIESFVQSEQFSSLYPGMERSVRLVVRQEDFEKATQILSEVHAETDGPMNVSAFCPNCDSQKTEPIQHSKKIIVLSWALAGIPFAFLKQKWKCLSCQHQWKF